MDMFTKIYQSINAVSQKVNSVQKNLDELLKIRADKNAQDNLDSQNALIELDDELHEEIAAIENALCDLSEEGE